MKKYRRPITFIWILCSMLSCKNETSREVNPDYVPKQPHYAQFSIAIEPDTINLIPAGSATTGISGFNYFQHNNSSFISLYEPNADQITIYKFPEANVIKVIPLKKWLMGIKLNNVSVFTINFDSILVCTKNSLILLDSASRIKNSIELPKNEKFGFANYTPGFIRNNMVFANNIKMINDGSLSELNSFKTLAEINLDNAEQKQIYKLPALYRKNIYGYSFLKYGYCVNKKGNIVFSFPADTNIYESDLASYHKSYYAKSKFQTRDITPITDQAIKEDQSFFEYSIRDSYGPIYYDPHNNRYLRVAKQKLADSVVYAKNRIRKRSIVILDESFRIIGEGEVPENVDVYTIFITANGSIYTRAVARMRPFVSFVKLKIERSFDSSQIAKIGHE